MQDEDIFSINTRKLYQHPAYRSHPCGHCGKEYSAVRYLDAHQRSGCSSTKRHLSGLLEQTKAHWESRKKRRIENDALEFEKAHTSGLVLETGSTQDPRHSSPIPSADAAASPGQSTQIPEDLDVPVGQRKTKRQKQVPVRYQHATLPQPPPAIDIASLERWASLAVSGAMPAGLAAPPPLPPALTLRTSKPNHFGVMKSYLLSSGLDLTRGPAKNTTLKHPTNSVARAGPQRAGGTLGPFPNESALLLADWYWQSTSKSFIDFQKLISIFHNQSFSLGDVLHVNWQSAFRALGANREDIREEEGAWIPDDGWISTPVSIDVPYHRRTGDPGLHSFPVGNLRHRSITSVIKETLTNPATSAFFHYHPYKATWKATSDSPELEIYGEMYTSSAFREADEKLQRQPFTTKNQGMERVIVALMFWSDGTQLTSFGGASLWPCYLFFGNESKYPRGQPSERLGHQIAYFLKLPDRFDDYLTERNKGKMPSDALLAYCARELFHQQWAILLDREFHDAMKNGIEVMCPDHKPRVIISGIRNNGLYPCHRCLVPKADIWQTGAPTDTERVSQQRDQAAQDALIREARASIREGYAVDSEKYVEALLLGKSLTPIENIFSSPRPGGTQLNIINALVVDILHEFEIGVWKKLYIHCLRLLEAFTERNAPDLTATLDSRYRSVASFGKDTIRKFPLNVSEMKRKAARDFEDLLQCAIPAFEGLLPEPHNTSLMTLLYVCAQWHALAKLRLHHERTLELLDYTTIQLGANMRRFERDTCSKVATRELAKEAEARARRQGNGSSTPSPASLSVFTIKFHFLGDYTSSIRRFGTTDSYSTQIGELYHRSPKSWYSRTDKKDYTTQLSQIERRQARLSWIMAEPVAGMQPGDGEPIFASADSPRQIEAPYIVGMNQNRPLSLNSFVAARQSADWNDSQFYKVDFITKLKQHLFARILKEIGLKEENTAPYREQWPHVVLQGNRLFAHQLMRINFTTYDVRRGEDVVHMDTPQCNVMLLNGCFKKDTGEKEHQYLYGKVIGIFHANVSYVGTLPEGANPYADSRFHRMDFTWIHRYNFCGSTTEFKLDQVSMVPISSSNAFDFVDPADIVRAVHLIPRFSAGKLDPQIPRSPLSAVDEESYEAYFINRFADRDLFMRYQHGMSVGHNYMHSKHSPAPALIPLIPSDFDHGLDCQITPSADSEGNGQLEGGLGAYGIGEVDDSDLAVFEGVFDNE